MKKFIIKNAFIWPLLGCLILWGLLGYVSGKIAIDQLLTAMKLASFTMLIGIAQMIVVTTGGGSIDLSLTYILTLGAYLSCSLSEVGFLFSLIITIMVGICLGLINGCINVYLKVHAMITTLATGYIIFSIILISSPYMKALPYKPLVSFINYNIAGISVLSIISIIIAGIIALVLYRTRFGMELHAVGQNDIAASYAGINVNKIKIMSFGISGGLAAVAGVLSGAFIGGAFQDMGIAYFLPAIAATFIGGTVADGGKSSVIGVCLGALMMSFMTSFLNTAQISVGYQRLIQGMFLVLILAVSVTNKIKR